MPQQPQEVVEITNPWDELICFRVPLSHKFHTARFGKIAVPIRKSTILVPDCASPLLRNLLGVLQGFAEEIKGDIPVNYQLLRVEFFGCEHRLDIIKLCREACRQAGMRPTIRDRLSIPVVA